MKHKEKVSKWVEDHKGVIKTGLVSFGIMVVGATAFVLGQRYSDYEYNKWLAESMELSTSNTKKWTTYIGSAPEGMVDELAKWSRVEINPSDYVNCGVMLVGERK